MTAADVSPNKSDAPGVSGEFATTSRNKAHPGALSNLFGIVRDVATIAAGKGTDADSSSGVDVMPSAPEDDATLEETPATQTCPCYGHEIERGLRFCRICGAEVNPTVPDVVAITPSTPTTCPHCGHEVTADALICNGCGRRIEREEAVEDKDARAVCPQCGSKVVDGERFCETCGHDFHPEEPLRTAASPNLSTCPHCGHKVKPDVRLCEYCGKAMGPGSKEADTRHRCWYCDSPVSDGAMFCPKCGYAVEPEESASQTASGISKCPYCGRMVAPHAPYCQTCGAKLRRNFPREHCL